MIRLGSGPISSQPVMLGREGYSGLMRTHGGPISDDESVNSSLRASHAVLRGVPLSPLEKEGPLRRSGPSQGGKRSLRSLWGSGRGLFDR